MNPLAQWTPIVVAPMTALFAQAVMYMTVDWSCVHERTWPIHAIAAVSAAITVATALLAHRTRDRGGDDPTRDARAVERTRFMGRVGMLAAIISLLTIVAMWIPLLFLGPCHHGG